MWSGSSQALRTSRPPAASTPCRPCPLPVPAPLPALFSHLGFCFLDTFLSLALPRQVAAPAWASSPAPGHLGLRGQGKGAGAGGGGGRLGGNARELAMGTSCVLVAPQAPRYVCRGLTTGSAPVAGVLVTTTARPGAGRGGGGGALDSGLTSSLSGPSPPTSNRALALSCPFLLLAFSSPWGSRSLSVSVAMSPDSYLDSFSEFVFFSPIFPSFFPLVSAPNFSLCMSIPCCVFPIRLHHLTLQI